MELFNKELITSTFNQIASDIVLNPDTDDEYTIKGFLTNATFSANARYHIHSLNRFRCGDYFNYDGDYYLITGDVAKRGVKYKSVADYCNIQFPIYEIIRKIVDYDEFGRPIYEDVEEIVGYNYGVIKHFTLVQDESAFIVAITDLVLTLRDSEENRDKFTINYELEFEGNHYKIIERDFTKKGIINCRLTLTT